MEIGFDAGRISSAEIHRFPNNPVTVNGTLYWDVLRLWYEIQQGLSKALSQRADGIAIDSFGVDFGLLDERGNLIGNPVHMRDRRTEGMMDWVFERIPRETLFLRTGVGFYIINSLYQLAALVNRDPWQLQLARTLLTMPNLLNYWLTGEKLSEFTHTTTTQCYNPSVGDWDRQTLETLGIPTTILPPIVQPGTPIGTYGGVPVFAVASHDTGSAVVAVPTQTPKYAFISSGTWSLFGVEVRQPILTIVAMNANLTNEGGAGGTYRALKMVMGLWIVQQCRAAWRQQGLEADYGVLLAQAQAETPFASFIDPDDPTFFLPGEMPERVRAFCENTGQAIPQSAGQVMRCVLESLALKYRHVLEQLVIVTGQPVDVLHIVGGGAQNPLLCQMTADATRCPVLAGPVEATALGNGLVQLIARGELRDLAEARQVVRTSYPPQQYEPERSGDWEMAYERFRKIITTV